MDYEIEGRPRQWCGEWELPTPAAPAAPATPAAPAAPAAPDELPLWAVVIGGPIALALLLGGLWLGTIFVLSL